MISPNETFKGTFPFEPHFSEAPGFKMHYVDEGDGEPIICLHGEPTWGYLYRNFIPPLAKTHRVIVPDHMGFGKSETPQDREYTLRTHVENLTAVIDDLGLQNITFVVQDWGGPIACGYTVRNAARVKRLCLMNTIMGYGGAVEDKEAAGAARAARKEISPWFQWVLEAHKNGTYEATMSNLKVVLPGIMLMLGFAERSVIDDTWLRAYTAPFQTKEECKGAIEFPLDVALRRIGDYVKEGFAGVGDLRSKPAMLAEGMLDRAILPANAIADFKALWPDGPVVELPGAGHFCQEDKPQALVALIQQFIQMT